MAVALPVLMLVLVAAIGLIGAVSGQLRCVDAAREGARLAARGEGPDAVLRAAVRVAPAGARVQIGPAGPGLVAVTVSAKIPAAGRLLPALSVSGRAVAMVETGLPP